MIILGPKRGRRPRAGTRATNRVEFVVTPDERAALAKVAHENHQPMAAMIRLAINTFVADYADRVVFVGSGDHFPKK